MVYRCYTYINWWLIAITISNGVWIDMKSCFFIGHRDTPETVLQQLIAAIERLIVEEDVGHFYVGQYGSFDRMAALSVKRLKQRYPFITLYLVLPYHPAERPMETPEGFDGTFYPPLEKVPRRYAIVRANRYMTETCNSVICYVHHIGNTRTLLEYAQRREKKGVLFLENLAETN